MDPNLYTDLLEAAVKLIQGYQLCENIADFEDKIEENERELRFKIIKPDSTLESIIIMLQTAIGSNHLLLRETPEEFYVKFTWPLEEI